MIHSYIINELYVKIFITMAKKLITFLYKIRLNKMKRGREDNSN